MVEQSKAIAALVAANPDVKAPGPTDQAGVAEALQDKASRQRSLKDFGAAWLLGVRNFFPIAAFRDDDFMAHYLDLKKSGNDVVTPPTVPELPTSAGLKGCNSACFYQQSCF